MANNRKPDRPNSCAKCGTSSAKLTPCESGFTCDPCMDAYRTGRDETTRMVKATRIVTLDGAQKSEAIEIAIPATADMVVPPKPANPVQELPPDIVRRDAANHRTELLSYLGNECAALALDLEATMHPKNRVEQMLLDLMAVSYKASLEMSSKGFLASDPADQTRLLNQSARMTETFHRSAVTFQRLQSGGNQQIIVQHVNVAQGGQAVVGNVHAGGGS
jgi:hypothetical protein